MAFGRRLVAPGPASREALGRAARGAVPLGLGRQPRSAPARERALRPSSRLTGQCAAVVEGHVLEAGARTRQAVGRRPRQECGRSNATARCARPSPPRARGGARRSRRRSTNSRNSAFVTGRSSIAKAGTSTRCASGTRCPSRRPATPRAAPSTAVARGDLDRAARGRRPPPASAARGQSARRAASGRGRAPGTCRGASRGASARARPPSRRRPRLAPGSRGSDERVRERRCGRGRGTRAPRSRSGHAGPRRVGVDADRSRCRARRACRAPAEGGRAEDAAPEVVPGEGGQVAEVEQERLAQRDRLLQPGLVGEDAEQAGPSAARPRAAARGSRAASAAPTRTGTRDP